MERTKGGKRSEEGTQEHRVTYMGDQEDSLTARLKVEVAVGFGEERGGGDSTRFERRGGKHNVEREKANPMVGSTVAQSNGDSFFGGIR